MWISDILENHQGINHEEIIEVWLFLFLTCTKESAVSKQVIQYFNNEFSQRNNPSRNWN